MEGTSSKDLNCTVGAFIEDHRANTPHKEVLTGELAEQGLKWMVENLNDAIQKIRKEMPDLKRFYIVMTEGFDCAFQGAIRVKRRIFRRRPYPEADTDVFRHDADDNRTFFCWSIPHSGFHKLMLANQHRYTKDILDTVKAWRAFDYDFFGFDSIKTLGYPVIREKQNFKDKDISE